MSEHCSDIGNVFTLGSPGESADRTEVCVAGPSGTQPSPANRATAAAATVVKPEVVKREPPASQGSASWLRSATPQNPQPDPLHAWYEDDSDPDFDRRIEKRESTVEEVSDEDVDGEDSAEEEYSDDEIADEEEYSDDEIADEELAEMVTSAERSAAQSLRLQELPRDGPANGHHEGAAAAVEPIVIGELNNSEGSDGEVDDDDLSSEDGSDEEISDDEALVQELQVEDLSGGSAWEDLSDDDNPPVQEMEGVGNDSHPVANADIVVEEVHTETADDELVRDQALDAIGNDVEGIEEPVNDGTNDELIASNVDGPDQTISQPTEENATGSNASEEPGRSTGSAAASATAASGQHEANRQMHVLSDRSHGDHDDNECSICMQKINELDVDTGRIDMRLTLPCRHYFGINCLLKSARKLKSCPYCRTPIPKQCLELLDRARGDQPAHTGGFCEANDRCFSHGQVFIPPSKPEKVENPTALHYEYASIYTEAAWTVLLCPSKHDWFSVTRKAHEDEVVVALGTKLHRITLPDGAWTTKTVAGYWWGPQPEGPASGRLAMNGIMEAKDERAGLIEAAIRVVNAYMSCITCDQRPRGGKLILKTSCHIFVNHISRLTTTYVDNGFTDSDGRPLRNQLGLQHLKYVVNLLKVHHDVTVYAWHAFSHLMQPLNTMLEDAQFDAAGRVRDASKEMHDHAREVWEDECAVYRDGRLKWLTPRFVRRQNKELGNFRVTQREIESEAEFLL